MTSLRLVSALAFVAACSRPKPVEVTPRSAQVSAIRADGVELTVQLEVHNPNTFAIRASDVTGVLESSNGSELGRGAATAAFTVPAEGRVTLPAGLAMRWTNLAQLAPYALSGQPLPYRVRGSAKIGSDTLNLDVPFSISGQLAPEQLLKLGLSGATSLTPQPQH